MVCAIFTENSLQWKPIFHRTTCFFVYVYFTFRQCRHYSIFSSSLRAHGEQLRGCFLACSCSLSFPSFRLCAGLMVWAKRTERNGIREMGAGCAMCRSGLGVKRDNLLTYLHVECFYMKGNTSNILGRLLNAIANCCRFEPFNCPAHVRPTVFPFLASPKLRFSTSATAHLFFASLLL